MRFELPPFVGEDVGQALMTSATSASASSTALRGSSTKPVWMPLQRVRYPDSSSPPKSGVGPSSTVWPGRPSFLTGAGPALRSIAAAMSLVESLRSSLMRSS